VSYSPDGRTILLVERDGLSVYEAPGGMLVRNVKPEGQAGDIRAACWTASGKALVVASGSSSPVVVDAETGKELVRLARAGDLTALAVSADGRKVAAAGRRVWLWELDESFGPAKTAPPAGKSAP
jgi:WD40 repeat protein